MLSRFLILAGYRVRAVGAGWEPTRTYTMLSDHRFVWKGAIYEKDKNKKDMYKKDQKKRS